MSSSGIKPSSILGVTGLGLGVTIVLLVVLDPWSRPALVGLGVLLMGVKKVVIGLTDLGTVVPESHGIEGQLTKLVALNDVVYF